MNWAIAARNPKYQEILWTNKQANVIKAYLNKYIYIIAKL